MDPTFDYHTSVSRAREREQGRETIRQGELIATYDVLDSAPVERSKFWPVIMLAVLGGLIGLAVSQDGWGSLTMILAFLVLGGAYWQTMRKGAAHRVPLHITTYGLELDGVFYPFSRFRQMYLLEFPGYVMITLVLSGRFAVALELYLERHDSVELLREELAARIPENLSARETLMQKLVRLLQL